MKKFFVFVFFTSLMLAIPSLVKRVTFGFKPAKIMFSFPVSPEWEVPAGEEIWEILSQPFFFLGKGAQCYVFESKDKAHVVKFFRYDLRKPEKKMIALFNACKLAYENLRKETGLVYIHLNESELGLPFLKCRDAIGRKYTFPMDKMHFVIQKKAKGFRQTLLDARGDPAEMKKRIDQFIELLCIRTSKGILNTDPTLSRNFGFLGDRAIEVDFGNYRLDSKLDSRHEIKRFTSRLDRWLRKKAPEWVFYLDERTNKSVLGYVSDSL
jgi:hypothetical protein